MVQLEEFKAKRPGRARKRVICLSCGGQGTFNPKGPNGVPAWLCSDYPGCDSYVGVHAGTNDALGTLANAALRAERLAAHRWIDRLWRGKKSPTRKEVYKLIGACLGVRHFHVAQCDMVLIQKLNSRRVDIARAFRDTEPGPRKPAAQGRGGASERRATEDAGIGDVVDKALLDALFTGRTRRLWPADPGGRAAATRCLLIGSVTSVVDGAGRRWITKKK